MQRRDFELIARVIRALPSHPETYRVYVAEKFADELATVNPSFDRERFLKACGVKL